MGGERKEVNVNEGNTMEKRKMESNICMKERRVYQLERGVLKKRKGNVEEEKEKAKYQK